MLRLIPLLLIIGFAGEIASIIWVGKAIGVLGTLVWLALDVFAGVALFRSTGLDMASAMRGSVGGPGTDKLFAARMISRVVAGLFLIIPGFFSDFLAGVLLLGPVQSWFASKVRFATRGSTSSSRYPESEPVSIIEGVAVEIDAGGDQKPKN